MKVAHFAVFAPSMSGMYESTKDQIKYERREGIDSIFVDGVNPKAHEMGWVDDGWLSPVDWREALNADVWVTHSNFPPPLKEYITAEPRNREKFKIVAIHHGPAEHMILKEYIYLQKNIDVNEDPAFTIVHINAIWNWDACVVLNKHEFDVSVLFDENDKLIHIQNSIDLERYNLDVYPWEFRNRPAIISCDVPRVEKMPVHIMLAMREIRKRVPSAKLNIYALPLDNIKFFRNLVCRVKDRMMDRGDYGYCENIVTKTNSVSPFIRGADIGFNSNYSGICSRVHMEMQAMGVPVISYRGDYTPYHARIFDLESIAEQVERCWNDLNDSSKTVREDNIAYARENYDRGKQVKIYVQLYQYLLDGKTLKEFRDEKEI